ncbi:MAG: hypothetical protein Q7J16_12145 [Candidatus Cloacimonadales bacterium]|nr:hypothetical protein [Candidatus Cloacimonadales bacterium]
MYRVNLSIIFLILFCSFSFILLPEDVVIDDKQSTTNNSSYNNNNQKFQEDFTNSLLFKIFISVVGFFLGIIANIRIIRYKEKRGTIIDSRKVFIDLFCKINLDRSSIINFISTCVDSSIPITDRTIKNLLVYTKGKKTKKINCAYRNYKEASTNYEKRFDGMHTVIYNFDEMKMKERFGENTKFKTGKDLCLHNLQAIIDLVK